MKSHKRKNNPTVRQQQILSKLGEMAPYLGNPLKINYQY